MKDELCEAFCNELSLHEVPAGLAVSTVFNGIGGEPLGFYIVGPDNTGLFHLEDNGTTVPLIEAEGADLGSPTRRDAFATMLEEYAALYDEDLAELRTLPIASDRIPHAALKFVALLLRIQDMVLLTPERALSTFKEDALKAIKDTLGGRAEIKENEPIVPQVEFPADVVIQAPDRQPVAVYLASTDQRVLEAVVAHLAALYERHVDCSVLALLERDSSVTTRMRRYAANRLTALPIFEGDRDASILRIQREVLGHEVRLQ